MTKKLEEMYIEEHMQDELFLQEDEYNGVRQLMEEIEKRNRRKHLFFHIFNPHFRNKRRTFAKTYYPHDKLSF